MDTVYQIGPVTAAFRDFPPLGLWPFRAWKLDPYRIDGGEPQLVVQWAERPVLPTGTPVSTDCTPSIRREYYRLPDETLLWQQLALPEEALQLQYLLSPDAKTITATWDQTETAGVAGFEALTFLIFYAFLHREVLTLHGALIEEGGRGFLLCADSGIGKTTHARLWRDCKNALILNGDRATCCREKGRWMGFGTPWCGTSGEYLNRRVPLQAIVLLERGEENRVTPVEPAQLLQYILPHVVYPNWDPTATGQMLSLLDDLLQQLPVLRLESTPDARAVEALYQGMENLTR